MVNYILGIETSCDETSAAVLKDGRELLANCIYSQIDVHKEYGGVVPEIASRKHLEKIALVVEEALKLSGIKKEELTAISVTNSPGLIGALLVGVTFAKGLSYSLGIPVVPVHHIRGHMYSNFLGDKEVLFPSLCLIVSGGHTTMALWKSHEEIVVLGGTLDDAAGEVYDKVARALGLSYPGGPEIEKLALKGKLNIKFPQANLGQGSLDFSFSGLKSSVLNFLNSERMKNQEICIEDVAHSFQEALISSLEKNVLEALKTYRVKSLLLAGGVVANETLVKRMEDLSKSCQLDFFVPKKEWCTDNGAMIAMAGYYLFKQGNVGDIYLNATPINKIQ